MSLAIAGTVVSGAANLTNAYSAYQQGKAEQSVARYQERAAQIAARDAEARGAAEEMRFRQRVSTVKGAQRAQLAASGVVLDQGSALDVLSDTAAYGELDALNIRADAQREALELRSRAKMFKYEGRASRQAAKMKIIGGSLSNASKTAMSLGSFL
jgi:hypothetical protein